MLRVPGWPCVSQELYFRPAVFDDVIHLVVMALNALPTEIIVDREILAHLYLDWEPQPGAYLNIEGQTYLVLERRHRYRLELGQYRLYRVALCVQKSQIPVERSLWDGHWVLGDTTCRFNARSPLLRCAVNPSGPCDHCIHYQPLTSRL